MGKNVKCWVCGNIYDRAICKCPSCFTGLKKPQCYTLNELLQDRQCKFQTCHELDLGRKEEREFIFACTLPQYHSESPPYLHIYPCEPEICPLFQTWIKIDNMHRYR